MIDKVFLITGGEAHKDAFNFLRDHKYNFDVLDDNPKCFLKKKYSLNKILKLSFLRNKRFNNAFLWSPCSDYGAYLADKHNCVKFKKRINNPDLIYDKYLQFKKLKNRSLFVKNILSNKLYLKKKRFGSGSRGIHFYNKKSINKNKEYLIQEFIKGIEVSIETISLNSRHELLNISYRLLKNYKSATVIYSPNFNSTIYKFFKKEVTKVLKKLNVLNGICHIEAILTYDKKFYPIDLNIRTGGAGISSELLPSITNLNVTKIDFQILSNQLNTVKKIKIKKNLNYGMLIYEYEKNFHLNKKLKNFKKYGNYNFLGNRFKNNSEIDKSRTASLFIKSSSKSKLLKKTKIILDIKSYNLIENIEKNLLKIIKK